MQDTENISLMSLLEHLKEAFCKTLNVYYNQKQNMMKEKQIQQCTSATLPPYKFHIILHFQNTQFICLKVTRCMITSIVFYIILAAFMLLIQLANEVLSVSLGTFACVCVCHCV